MTLERVWLPSPNYSSRGGSPVRLIVVHTTEGAQDIYSLGNFFANAGNQVSSHVGTDNHRSGVIAEYVSRGNKAWTQGNANPYCVSCEQCTPSGASANWSRDYWLSTQMQMLKNTAAWVAEESAKFSIPIRALSSSEAQSGMPGVCQHVNLGAAGGGHVDCGNGYPMDVLIDLALGNAPLPPEPEPPETEELDMFSIPPKAVANRAFGISLNGPHTSMGVCVDSSAEGNTQLRAAFHNVNGGWQVVQVYTDADHNKVVVTPKNKFDGVSLRRVDDSDVDVCPNFGQ